MVRQREHEVILSYSTRIAAATIPAADIYISFFPLLLFVFSLWCGCSLISVSLPLFSLHLACYFFVVVPAGYCYFLSQEFYFFSFLSFALLRGEG